MIIRITFMEPLVAAAQPPIKKRVNSKALGKAGQISKSPMVYPDVVAMEVTWKNACLKDVNKES